MQHARAGCLICTSLAEEVDVAASCPEIPALEDIDFDRDPLLIPRLSCDRAETMFSFRADYPDDSIPYVAPRYGSGIIGGMLLGELRFGANTSWVDPVGTTLDEAIDFPWGQENVWIDRVVDGLNYTARRLTGKCYSFLEGYHTPLEWASLIRGSGLYLDLCTQPEKVHTLLRRCDEALMWLYGVLETRVKNESHGILAHSLWMERGVPFLSDDSAGLISPDQYREFGLPYTDKMFARYGGGFLHVHTQAYHQMDNLSAMTSLTIYAWRTDPNIPEPFELLARIAKGAKKKIVMIGLTTDQIRKNIALLAQGRFLIRTTCRDRTEQAQIIELVKEKAPLC